MSKSRGRNRPNPDRRLKAQKVPSDTVWIWGHHPVAAALANPDRQVLELLATRNAAQRLPAGAPSAELVSAEDLAARLGKGAVHQGIAARCRFLDPVALEEVIASGTRLVVVADQLSDPHNLGAIIRSCAAFGAGAVVLQTRNTPALTGTVTKSAAGAVDIVAECRVVNIARALDMLAGAGFHTVGLSGGGLRTVDAAFSGAQRLAIVLGAEGSGLRPAVAKACAELAHIPIDPRMESLNVSNAAAIALYIAHSELDQAARP